MTTLQLIYVNAHRRFWERENHDFGRYMTLCRWAAHRWGEHQELMRSHCAMHGEPTSEPGE